ncbi:phosphopantothenoylcysteine decarboxylase isoform X2 [Hemicordylus capensis]|uniref:phosphopantothenoylcysteine decarboxylase isoform X2 n=1 Tax=Hemicordylus capensis TaxID=884348 RepID=UPI0023047D67|nr:phosphopantothenoylcysteine decarboxylase isoform X2 [Hemicordylus capensis]
MADMNSPKCPTPQPQPASTQKSTRILIGVTGSVAALKLPLLISELLKIPSLEVQVVTTEHAKHFYNPHEIPVTLYSDTDEWETCIIRAWDLSKPLLFCPAMNTAMWEHPITVRQVEQLKGFGYVEVPCIVKKLVCGDEGRGAMAEVPTIVERVKSILSEWGRLPT